MAMGLTSRMLLPEALTGSNDMDSYVTRFDLLEELQIGKELNDVQGVGEWGDEVRGVD